MRQAELIALIDERRAAQREKQRHHQLRALQIIVSEPRGKADDVVIGERPRGPAACAFPLRHRVLHDSSRHRALAEQKERVRCLQAVRSVGVFALNLQWFFVFDLTNGHRAVLIEQRAQTRDEVKRLGLRAIIEVALELVRAWWRALQRRDWRIVAQLRVLREEVHNVEPKAINAALKPKPRDIQQRILHSGVAHIEVGLLRQEVVQIILPPP